MAQQDLPLGDSPDPLRPAAWRPRRGALRCAAGLALLMLWLGFCSEEAVAAASKSVQTEGVWVGYDAASQTVTIRVTKPGKGATPPKALRLKAGKEALFKVKPEGSLLTRTMVAIKGRKADLAEIEPGTHVNVYWVPDPDDKQARFARKIDVFKRTEDYGEDAGD